jgi:hypothetical protein
MNWEKGIIIGLGLFISFILFLVINLMRHRVDLQSEDYYKKEIAFESEIKAMKKAESLSEKMNLSLTDDYLVLKIPDSLNARNVEVRLLRPDDETMDKAYKINGTKTYLIPLKDLKKGTYDTEIYFTVSSETYLQKTDVYIP